MLKCVFPFYTHSIDFRMEAVICQSSANHCQHAWYVDIHFVLSEQRAHPTPKQNWISKEKYFAFAKIIYMEVYFFSLIVFPPRFLFLSMSTPSRCCDQMDIWTFCSLYFPSTSLILFMYSRHVPLSANMKNAYINRHPLSARLLKPNRGEPNEIINIFHLWYEFSSNSVNFICCLN